MNAIINSFLLVFLSEMGDKTQLLSLVLVARYRQPWIILLGVFTATLLNHGFASWAGGYVAGYVSEVYLRWILALTFWIFGLWILIPDKHEEIKLSSRWGAYFNTCVAFFIAEMGDKTQLATIALGAQYSSVAAVTFGSTLGMLLANGLAVFLGDRLLAKISMTWVRRFASVLFILFGIALLIRTT